MKLSVLPVVIAIIVASPHAAGSRPDRVPTDLVRIDVFGPHRLLVFQVCSAEHCWHQLFVQELSDSISPEIICSKPVAELNDTSDIIVWSTGWQDESPYTLDLMLHSSRNAFETRAATLSFASDCAYKLQPGVLPAANNSSKSMALHAAPDVERWRLE